MAGRGPRAAVTVLLDTNILVRHFTGDPPDQALRATAFLHSSQPGELLLLDLVAAELVYVLQSVYRQPRPQVARLLRSTLGLHSIHCENLALLHRAIELYAAGADWTDAYLAATAESRGVAEIVSFDRGLPRIPDVRRVEPPEV
jgi:predicted nucleic acid-binding protein